MTPKQVIRHYGGAIEAAQALGFTVPAVRYWLKHGLIPRRTQERIEHISGGKLKAERRMAK